MPGASHAHMGASCPDVKCVGCEGGEQGDHEAAEVTDGLRTANLAPGESGFTGRRHED